MSKRSVLLSVLASLAAISLWAVAAQAVPPWKATPLFGESEGTSEVTGLSGGIVSSESEGTFISNHLGRGTYTAATTQDYPRHVENEHTFGNCAFVDGDLVLTAANGDELHVALDGDRSVNCAPDEQGPVPPAEGDVYTSTLYGEITGGTGRFTNATGYLFSKGTHTITEDGTADEASIYGDISY